MDLDEYAVAQEYTPPGALGERLTPELIQAVRVGRTKGYSWAFITTWLEVEHAIVLGNSTLQVWFKKHYPETR